MSYNSTGTFTAGICVEKLLDLADIKGNLNNPLFKRSQLGYVEAILSPLNTSGRTAIQTQEGSKRKSVRIKWLQRTVDSQILSEKSSTCTTDNYDDFEEETVTLSKSVEYKFGINTDEVKNICEGRLDFLRMMLLKSFNALTREINDSILTDQALNMGINITTGTANATTLTVFPDATGNPNARPLQKIKYDFSEKNEMMGSPMVIGSGYMSQYMRTLAAGCCNDGGVDMLSLSNQMGWSPFIDTQLESVFGANHFIVLEPGSAQFLQFNSYVGEDATKAGDSVVRTTIKDPRTGIVYDLKVLQNDCDDNYVVIINLTYDIWFTPIAQYHFDDPLYGTRGSLRYVAAVS